MNSEIFEYFETISKLTDIEQVIVKKCYFEGRVTQKQLIDMLEIGENTLLIILRNLIENKIIFKIKYQNIEFYELKFNLLSKMQYEKFPSGPVIPLIYQLNLLKDNKRMDAFKNAIYSLIKPDDIVLDLGCGTGVLSLLAASRGAKVYAIEADPYVFNAAEYFIKNNGYESKINLINDDSRNIKLDLQADIIICEMLDSALISELQVEVMNDAVKKWLKPSGSTIPNKLEISLELVNVDFTIENFEFPLLHYEEYGIDSSQSLSEIVKIAEIDFKIENEMEMRTRVCCKILRDGKINGLRLRTDLFVSESIIHRGSSWLNPHVVFPFRDLLVLKNSIIEIELSYGYGKGFTDVKYEINKRS